MTQNEVPLGSTLRSWVVGPPRAHGEVLEDRTVSFLELFYDLVFVVLIAQVAHALAGDVSWTGLRNFVIVFSLVWIAWVNGSFYHELHGREDGRSRMYIFVQMALLVVLAVFAEHAADTPDDGRNFAIVYAILMSFIALQWLGIRRHDSPEMAALTTRYVAGMGIVIALIAASALVDDQDLRLVLWVVAIILTLLGTVFQVFRTDPRREEAMHVTESLAERFGLFTIIVLGEVVVGVVDGLSEVERRDPTTIATAVIGLTVGFGFWWNYFDFVGRRPPKRGAVNRGIWNFGHMPMWLAIAAGGAGMVPLVEHAQDGRTPANTAWLVTGSTALIMMSLAVIVRTMPPHPGRQMVPASLAVGAAVVLILGAVRPSPLILVIALNVVLSVVWIEAFVRHARSGRPIGVA